jgi:hypothetical protein
MTSKRKELRARFQATGGTLLKSTGELAAPPFKEFKLGGEVCRITLTAPIVEVEGSKFQIHAPKVWDIPFGDSEKDLAKWLRNLKEPTPIRGFYCPAEFEVQFAGFQIWFTLERNLNKQQNSNEPEILVTNLEISSAIPQGNLTLPLPRLKVWALQLSGLFGTAYPPNFRKYFADGKSYFQTDENGAIDIDRYGYQITRSSALVLTEGENPRSRLLNDKVLADVARLHKTLPHGSKIQDISKALNISERSVRFYVAQARHPKFGLLEPTGRKRSKTKKQTKGKKK